MSSLHFGGTVPRAVGAQSSLSGNNPKHPSSYSCIGWSDHISNPHTSPRCDTPSSDRCAEPGRSPAVRFARCQGTSTKMTSEQHAWRLMATDEMRKLVTRTCRGRVDRRGEEARLESEVFGIRLEILDGGAASKVGAGYNTSFIARWLAQKSLTRGQGPRRRRRRP